MKTSRWSFAPRVALLGFAVLAVAGAQDRTIAEQSLADKAREQLHEYWLKALGNNAAVVIAVRDAESGALRAPEPEERAALLGRSGTASARTAASTSAVKLPDGGLKLPANPADMDFVIARKNPDGSIVIKHASTQGGSDEQ